MTNQLLETIERSDLQECDGIWMSYTADENYPYPYHIPVRISVRKQQADQENNTGAAVGIGTFTYPVDPIVLFGPTVYQDHAIHGLSRIRKLIVKSKREGEQAMVAWSEEQGVRVCSWTLEFEALDDPYNAYLEQFENYWPLEDTQILVPLEQGWTKQGIKKELGSILEHIEKNGLCVGFKFTHDSLFYFISKGLNVEACLE